jgi:microsomal epoxide hydrolase
LPQFVADVDGQRVHFIHRRGAGPNPYPLVITHGWPGSVFEFDALIERLCDPAAFGGDPHDAFDVVAPSLPGFLFAAAGVAGVAAFQVADCWAALMAGLGYRRFGAQGGDLGASCRSRSARDMRTWSTASTSTTCRAVTSLRSTRRTADRRRTGVRPGARRMGRAGRRLCACAHDAAADAAAALNDSPAGLAAWIAEKFRAWSDCDGDVARRFSHDTLLTGISLYWFSACIGSSMQMYWENRLQPMRFAAGQRVTVPIAFALSEGDQPAAAQLGRTGVRRRAVDRHAERRPFRGDGRTGPAGRRYSAVLSAFSMMGGGRVANADERGRPPPARSASRRAAVAGLSG